MVGLHVKFAATELKCWLYAVNFMVERGWWNVQYFFRKSCIKLVMANFKRSIAVFVFSDCLLFQLFSYLKLQLSHLAIKYLGNLLVRLWALKNSGMFYFIRWSINMEIFSRVLSRLCLTYYSLKTCYFENTSSSYKNLAPSDFKLWRFDDVVSFKNHRIEDTIDSL